jgi:hydroxyethylthiazole kinase-like uncharacterized protein yjeF
MSGAHLGNEVLTNAQMAAADNFAAMAGTPTLALMENAGRAVADAIVHRFAPCAVSVLCGPGNNGGDGFVVARLLAERGFQVRLAAWESYKGDAGRMADRWQGNSEPLHPKVLDGAALAVDALFGTGLSRPLEGAPRDLALALKELKIPVVAVDIPSGIAGDSGRILGDVAVAADLTVTFFRKKPAHLLLPGRLHCGRVRVADIGIAAGVLDEIKPQTFENTPQFWHRAFPVPRVDAHKYARGHVLAVSGDMAATGAARMAARGALRAGAGLVTLASPRDALAINATALTAVMVRPVDTALEFGEQLADRRFNACIVGPGAGLGERTRDFVHTALSAKRALVLDADALTSFSDGPERLFESIKTAGEDGERHVVLTPHEGEFPRLFSDISNKHPGRSKLERVRAAAERSGAVVLLKGPDTTVAAPDGRATIAGNAPPWLATAGAGDVLSGIIAGLMAQGVGAFEAASMGVWMHGEAGREAGPGLIAEDLPEVLPAVHRHIYDELGIDY